VVIILSLFLLAPPYIKAFILNPVHPLFLQLKTLLILTVGSAESGFLFVSANIKSIKHDSHVSISSLNISSFFVLFYNTQFIFRLT
jgi:hypothetical protein